MSSWWCGQATKVGEKAGCNNSLSSSTATANTSTKTSVRDDVETAYSNSNNNSIRHLQREQPSMPTPNTHHHRTRNKRFVSSTNKTLLPAALISKFSLLASLLDTIYIICTSILLPINQLTLLRIIWQSAKIMQAAILLIYLYLLWK